LINAVILDWSGVVSDDIGATFAMINEILERNGKERLGMEEFRARYELPWMDFYKKLGIRVEPAAERQYWEENFPRHYGKVHIIPGAKEALEKMRAKKLEIIVFSAHNKKLLLEEIKSYGIEGLIDEVHANVNDKRLEIEGLVEKHKMTREKTLYAGDMVHDIETARLAGIRSVAVLSGYSPKGLLETAKPDFFVKDLAELPALIERIDGGQK
jgi:phosphoglycolate phosphatase